MKIAFIGFGEAARAFVDTLAKADNAPAFSAYDIRQDAAMGVSLFLLHRGLKGLGERAIKMIERGAFTERLGRACADRGPQTVSRHAATGNPCRRGRLKEGCIQGPVGPS